MSTDPDPASDPVARVRDAMRAMLDGRPVLLAGGTLVGLGRHVRELTELSGHPPFLLAFGEGTGQVPDPADAPRHVIDAPATDVLDAVRRVSAVLADPPAEAIDAVDRWDPERRALVLAGPFFTPRRLAGRAVLDGRLPEWEALEDKSTTDALWDQLGVRRAPAAVVPATYADAAEAAGALDRGSGTVWSGDSREGFNGGAAYVRWVRTEDQARGAAAFLGEHCDRLRVMPFLDGVPCSIHGFVLPDGVAALRPVEMIVLRRATSDVDQFVYAGASTCWDPPAADRDAMRDVARTVARGLRERVGYRGGFSVDGVLTADGFLPTELNPRFSGGLAAISQGMPDFPLALVQAALVSGHDPGIGAAAFEQTLVRSADAHRWGGGGVLLSTVQPERTERRAVVLSGGPVLPARHGELPEAELMLGPSQVGGFLRLELTQGCLPAGARIAPRVVEAFALADRLWGTGLGATTAAPDAR